MVIFNIDRAVFSFIMGIEVNFCNKVILRAPFFLVKTMRHIEVYLYVNTLLLS